MNAPHHKKKASAPSGGHREGSGAKPKYGTPMKRTAVSLLLRQEDFAFLRGLTAEGTVSAGVRHAIDLARTRLDTVPQ